ncbi:response regulator [Poseidonocella sp. HB161398]|uniref:response regulator n=1 Tax=Poseidonocella sp. HB161398 TaxID=2320855 RepID=UPI001486D2EA|nr:response regulator [Poseidonocella sp. HB161398]
MSQKPVLLFVDDEERIVKLLKIMFRAEYEVHTALSGADALAIMETVDVDVIASDQRMPNMTGIELLSQVRERWPSTVRVLLTGYSDLVAIIGAVNEGEVFRFLNKPWNQQELRSVITEAVDVARGQRKLESAIPPVWQAAEPPAGDSFDSQPQFSIGSQLLAIDGVESDRQSVLEMFTRDYNVRGAASIREGLEIVRQEQIGVIVINAELEGTDVSELLAQIADSDPAITVVAMTANPNSDTIIKLINRGKIYRFAIKPLSPNLFRLAVNTAMREHHRRLADPRVIRRRMQRGAEGEDPDNAIYESFVQGLSRFTKVD